MTMAVNKAYSALSTFILYINRLNDNWFSMASPSPALLYASAVNGWLLANTMESLLMSYFLATLNIIASLEQAYGHKNRYKTGNSLGNGFSLAYLK